MANPLPILEIQPEAVKHCSFFESHPSYATSCPTLDAIKYCYMQNQEFTPETASRLIPWLEDLFKQGDEASGIVQTSRAQINKKLLKGKSNGHSKIVKELSIAETALKNAEQQISTVIQEINDKGIFVRDIKSGLVDFPSRKNGDQIFLCWIRGEQSIQFWHGLNEGYLSRKPL